MKFVLGTGFGAYIPMYLYLGMLGGALLSIVWRPRLSFYLLMLLIPLQTTRARLIPFPLGSHVVDILWVTALLGAFVCLGGPFLLQSSLNKAILLLAVTTYLSLWRGWVFLGGPAPIDIADPRFSDWKNYMVMPILTLVAAATLRDRKHLKIAVLIVIVGLCLVNYSFLRSSVGRDFSHFSDDVRDEGVLGYAGVNGLSAFVAQTAVLCAVLFFFVRQRMIRLILAGVMALSVYSLLFSFSRGGYAAFLAGISFLALYRQKKLLIGVAALLISWQTIVPTAVRERITMTYDSGTGELDHSAAERVDLWQDALSLISEHPVEGTGYDTYQFMHRVGPYTDTHDYYLKVFVEMGAIGVLVLLVVLFQLWRIGMELYRKADDWFLKALGFGLAAMVVCTTVANLFGDRWSYLQVNGFIWVLAGCVIRGLYIVAHEQAEERVAADELPIAGETGSGDLVAAV